MTRNQAKTTGEAAERGSAPRKTIIRHRVGGVIWPPPTPDTATTATTTAVGSIGGRRVVEDTKKTGRAMTTTNRPYHVGDVDASASTGAAATPDAPASIVAMSHGVGDVVPQGHDDVNADSGHDNLLVAESRDDDAFEGGPLAKKPFGRGDDNDGDHAMAVEDDGEMAVEAAASSTAASADGIDVELTEAEERGAIEVACRLVQAVFDGNNDGSSTRTGRGKGTCDCVESRSGRYHGTASIVDVVVDDAADVVASASESHAGDDDNAETDNNILTGTMEETEDEDGWSSKSSGGGISAHSFTGLAVSKAIAAGTASHMMTSGDYDLDTDELVFTIPNNQQNNEGGSSHVGTSTAVASIPTVTPTSTPLDQRQKQQQQLLQNPSPEPSGTIPIVTTVNGSSSSSGDESSDGDDVEIDPFSSATQFPTSMLRTSEKNDSADLMFLSSSSLASSSHDPDVMAGAFPVVGFVESAGVERKNPFLGPTGMPPGVSDSGTPKSATSGAFPTTPFSKPSKTPSTTTWSSNSKNSTATTRTLTTISPTDGALPVMADVDGDHPAQLPPRPFSSVANPAPVDAIVGSSSGSNEDIVVIAGSSSAATSLDDVTGSAENVNHDSDRGRSRQRRRRRRQHESDDDSADRVVVVPPVSRDHYLMDDEETNLSSGGAISIEVDEEGCRLSAPTSHDTEEDHNVYGDDDLAEEEKDEVGLVDTITSLENRSSADAAPRLNRPSSSNDSNTSNDHYYVVETSLWSTNASGITSRNSPNNKNASTADTATSMTNGDEAAQEVQGATIGSLHHDSDAYTAIATNNNGNNMNTAHLYFTATVSRSSSVASTSWEDAGSTGTSNDNDNILRDSTSGSWTDRTTSTNTTASSQRRQQPTSPPPPSLDEGADEKTKQEFIRSSLQRQTPLPPPPPSSSLSSLRRDPSEWEDDEDQVDDEDEVVGIIGVDHGGTLGSGKNNEDIVMRDLETGNDDDEDEEEEAASSGAAVALAVSASHDRFAEEQEYEIPSQIITNPRNHDNDQNSHRLRYIRADDSASSSFEVKQQQHKQWGESSSSFNADSGDADDDDDGDSGKVLSIVSDLEEGGVSSDGNYVNSRKNRQSNDDDGSNRHHRSRDSEDYYDDEEIATSEATSKVMRMLGLASDADFDEGIHEEAPTGSDQPSQSYDEDYSSRRDDDYEGHPKRRRQQNAGKDVNDGSEDSESDERLAWIRRTYAFVVVIIIGVVILAIGVAIIGSELFRSSGGGSDMTDDSGTNTNTDDVGSPSPVSFPTVAPTLLPPTEAPVVVPFSPVPAPITPVSSPPSLQPAISDVVVQIPSVVVTTSTPTNVIRTTGTPSETLRPPTLSPSVRPSAIPTPPPDPRHVGGLPEQDFPN